MKKLILVANLLLGIASPLAWAGTGTHGGDEDREYVMRIWRTSAAHVERHQIRFPEVSSQVLSQVIENGPRPEFTNRLRPCDGLVDPIACFNAQTGVVTFKRARFQALTEEEKIRIGVHEMFRLVHMDDGYALSQRLLGIVPPSQYFDTSSQYCPRNREYCEFERELQSLNIYVLSGQRVTFVNENLETCFMIDGISVSGFRRYRTVENGGYLQLLPRRNHMESEELREAWCREVLATPFRFSISNPVY